ncbi:MAG: ATP-grasp domain-containing protein [Acetobacterales bacterium]
MLPLTEDRTKRLLAEAGLPVPRGIAAASARDAAAAARELGGSTVLKALVPAGRRGKAGAIRFARSPEEAALVADELLALRVEGHAVERVYVEEAVDIARELYIAFTLEGLPPVMLLSRHGGVEVEETRAADPDAVLSVPLDPRVGVRPWAAVAHWRAAGIEGAALPVLGQLAARLWQAFRDHDALMLEINPLALDGAGRPVLVGAMMGLDEDALPRQAWRFGGLADWMVAAGTRTPRERAVREAQFRIRGGMIRYIELDGDIGLITNGGGAGLYQHDLVLSLGGRPANHSDQNGINVEKLKVLVNAVLDNPDVKGLLVGANHQQMTRTDRKIQSVIEVLQERGVDATRLPVVIRMFGPHEEEARALAAQVPGVRYLPREATLEDACRLVVELTAAVRGGTP